MSRPLCDLHWHIIQSVCFHFWPAEPYIIRLLPYDHIIPSYWTRPLKSYVRKILFTSSLDSTLLRQYCFKQWCHISHYPNVLCTDIDCLCSSYLSAISTYTMTTTFTSYVLAHTTLGGQVINFHPERAIATDDINTNWPVTRLPSWYLYIWPAIKATHCPPECCLHLASLTEPSSATCPWSSARYTHPQLLTREPCSSYCSGESPMWRSDLNSSAPDTNTWPFWTMIHPGQDTTTPNKPHWKLSWEH